MIRYKNEYMRADNFVVDTPDTLTANRKLFSIFASGLLPPILWNIVLSMLTTSVLVNSFTK